MIKYLKELQKEITGEINKDSNSIVDGVVNCQKYSEVETRILWVLKEPNSYDANWSYQDFLSIKDMEAKIGTKENVLNMRCLGGCCMFLMG